MVRSEAGQYPGPESKSKELKLSYLGDKLVLGNFLEKARRQKAGDESEKDIRTAVVFMGGGQTCAVEVGISLALEELDLSQVIDNGIGVSGGATILAYLMSGTAKAGESIVPYGLPGKKLWRPLRGVKKWFNLSSLAEAIDEKPPDYQALQKHPGHLWVGVTQRDTGQAEFIDITKTANPRTYLLASMCPPVLSDYASVIINGEHYVDGSIVSPLPPLDFVNKLDPPPTDIIVALTTPLSVSGIFGQFKGSFLYRGVSTLTSHSVLRKPIINMEKNYRKALLEYILHVPELYARGVRIGMFYPEVMPIEPRTMDSKKLAQSQSRAYQQALGHFTR